VWQLQYWRNTVTLFQRALAITDRNAHAHVSLALWFTQHGEPQRAVRHYREALAFEPGYPAANNNYGNILAEAGQTQQARQHFERAIRAQPRYAEAHNNLANLLARQGDAERALRHYAAAVRLDPELAQAHYNYGVTLASVGRLRDAQARLERSLQLRPDHADARYAYGLVMAGLGYEIAATGQLRDANFLRRDWFEALRSLAWLLATSPEPEVRNGAQAIVVAQRANHLSGFENPVALDTLAAAYAEAGQFDSAVATATRAEQLARANGQNDLADRFARRLELYRARKPFHRAAGATTRPFDP
jgi:Tfp pilus assembly protein PilF